MAKVFLSHGRIVAPFTDHPVPTSMSAPSDAIEQFLREAESIYDEYEQGYVDADAALRMLRPHLEDLAESVE